jgi:PAS domain S-box-containing protein
MQPEDIFRALVESEPDAVVVTDGRGEIVLVNSQVEKTFGYPRHELLGQPMEKLIPASVADTAGTAGPGPLGVSPDLKLRRQDGREFPAEICPRPIESSQGIWTASFIQAKDRGGVEREPGKIPRAI